jgi:PST family polysaccharide transporter
VSEDSDESEDTPRDLTSTVVRGVSLAASGYLVAQALNLGFYVALARLLEPTDFGEFAAATVLIGFTLLLTESGLASAVIQRRNRVEEAASTAVFATIASGTIFSLLALATAPLVGAFFDSATVTALAAASAGTIFLRTAASIPDALLQRRFSFLRRLVIEPATVVAFGTAAVIAAASGLGAWALVIGQYAGFGIDVILAWTLVRWRPSWSLASFPMWRELVGYGRHVLVATAVLHAGEQASTLIVGRALGTGPLGQFRYALRLASTPFALLLAGAAYVLFPAFSRIAEDAARLEGAFLRSLRWICVLSFPAGLVFVPLGIPLAVIVFGDVWRPAGEALVAMCLFPAGGMLASVVSEALKAIGQPRLLTRMHAVTSSLTVVSMLALIPVGLTAASAGLSIGAMAGGVYALFLIRGAAGISLSSMVREVLPPAAAAVIAALALLPLELLVVDAESHSTALAALLLLGEATLGGLVYLGLLALLAPATARELLQGAGRLVRRVAGFRGPDPETPEPEILDETLAP